jgi:hypothetical protein
MVQVGDQVVVDGRKVGQQRRPGVVTAVNGSLVSVRWEDGHQSTFVPAAGTMSVVKGEAASGR